MEKYKKPISKKDLEQVIDNLLELLKKKVDKMNEKIKEPDYEWTERLRHEIKELLKDLREAERRLRNKTE